MPKRNLWPNRWENWTDEQLAPLVVSFTPGTNEQRFERFSRLILTHIRPETTLDIGGGSGQLGQWLPGKYTVMDHPRMQQFCEADFIPIGPIDKRYDLIVNTSSWGETDVETITAYVRQIEEVGCPYMFLCNRRKRQVDFDQYPLENWEPIVKRFYYGTKFIEWLGKLK